MKIKKLLPLCALSLVSLPALAWTTISIKNDTADVCKMIGDALEEVNGAAQISQDISTIDAGDSVQFWLYPGVIHGPDVIATYKCGGKIVKFESAQGNGIFMCDAPVATPLEVDPKLELSSTQSNGWRLANPSLFHSGTIDWTISSKS